MTLLSFFPLVQRVAGHRSVYNLPHSDGIHQRFGLHFRSSTTHFVQKIEAGKINDGDAISLSMLKADGTFYTNKGKATGNGSIAQINYGEGAAYYNFTSSWIVVSVFANKTADIKAVKIELGDKQTLAHQDANGKWVLNEIPDKGMELLKCIQSTADSADTYANKVIHHTGNKPSGSYTGNGDGTARTIETGGTGGLIFIHAQHSIIGFACYYGGVMFNLSNSTTKYYTRTSFNFTNGVLTIATSDAHLNFSGTEFQYQVL